MNLAQMLREVIRLYVEGGSDLAALRIWLADHVQEISESDDPDVDRLDGQAWILISELDYGHRDETDVRTALAAMITGESRVMAVESSYVMHSTTAVADHPEPAVTVYEPLMPSSRVYERGSISTGREAHSG